MNILIFAIVLGSLVFVHELGHFLFAKLFGVRVDNFGFGYPPRMFTIGHWKGTRITMNWIPFGGFVTLFGENDDGKELSEEEKKVSLIHKPRWQQFIVMFGGILFNIILGWLLLAFSYSGGIDVPVNQAPESYVFEESNLVISSVIQGAPAELSGIQTGDVVLQYSSPDIDVMVSDEDRDEFSMFINDAGSKNHEIEVFVQRGDSIESFMITPQTGLIDKNFAIGVEIERIGNYRIPFFRALGVAASSSVKFIHNILLGFGKLITGQLSLDALSGPVGIVEQVGKASSIGFSYLIQFTALLSFNLAVLNAFPFPALDGGRIVIIFIESIIRRRLSPQIVNWINGVGFIILIAFMLFITAKDIIKLF